MHAALPTLTADCLLSAAGFTPPCVIAKLEEILGDLRKQRIGQNILIAPRQAGRILARLIEPRF